MPGAESAAAVETGTVNVPNGAKYYRACTYTPLLLSGYYVQQIIPADAFIKIEQEIDGNSQSIASNQGRTGTLELMESINKPFDFSGKVITAFGDSITQGVTSPNMQMATPYIEYFADHVGATVSNKAVSGKCISGDDANSIYQKVLALTGATDYIVIAGGTNDYATDKPLGDYSSTAGTSTFYGALKGICDFLAANYATTPVIFITPIPFTRYTTDRKNAEGCLLDDYRRAIYQIATLYGHSVVNGASLGMPNTPGRWGNAMIDDTDGVHPTEVGHKLMARSLAGKLL